MKRIILILVFLLQLPVMFFNGAYADDAENVTLNGGIIFDENNTVYLDSSIKKPTLNIKNKNTLIPIYTPTYTDSRIRSRSALAQASKLNGEEYYMTPFYNSLNEQNGNFSYGTYYGADMDNAQLTYSSTFFSRYDAKKMAIMATVSNDTQSIDGSYQSMFGIAPELKITKYLALRDTYKTYVGVPVKKNKIALIYTPEFKKHVDNLWFELGFTQSFYETGSANASFEFSTKFKL